MDFSIADILYFSEYVFTDTGETARHFALVLLSSKIVCIDHNVLCAVITSQKSRYLSLKLIKEKYNCFNKDSYICFDRRDINPIALLHKDRQQPVGHLDAEDIKKSFKILKIILYGSADKYLVATIVREWKQIK